MSRCPVGENCTGCQYAEHCAHPEVQAERLRADVKQPSRRRRRLTRERDAARFDAAKLEMENECLRAACGFLPLSIREAVRRGNVAACHEWARRAEDLAKDAIHDRAEVERLKREAQDARRAALEEAAGIADAYAKRLIDFEFANETGFFASDWVVTPEKAEGAEEVAVALLARAEEVECE